MMSNVLVIEDFSTMQDWNGSTFTYKGDTYTAGVDAFMSINDAVQAVADGGTVSVTAGTYNEYVAFTAAAVGDVKGFTISGEVDTDGNSLVAFNGKMMFGDKGTSTLNKGITVTNIDFTHVSTYDASVIELRQVYGFNLSNCSFRDENGALGGWNPLLSPSGSVQGGQGVGGVWIDNCVFEGGIIGLNSVDKRGSYTYGFKMTDSTLNGAYLNAAGGSNTVVDNCQFFLIVTEDSDPTDELMSIRFGASGASGVKGLDISNSTFTIVNLDGYEPTTGIWAPIYIRTTAGTDIDVSGGNTFDSSNDAAWIPVFASNTATTIDFTGNDWGDDATAANIAERIAGVADVEFSNWITGYDSNNDPIYTDDLGKYIGKALTTEAGIGFENLDTTGNAYVDFNADMGAGAIGIADSSLDGDAVILVEEGVTVSGFTGVANSDISGAVSIEFNGTALADSTILGVDGGSADSVSISINGTIGSDSLISFGNGAIAGDAVLSFNGTLEDGVIISGGGSNVGGTSILELDGGVSAGTFQGFEQVYFLNDEALDFGTISTTGTVTEFFFADGYDFSLLSGTLSGLGVIIVDDDVVQELRNSLTVDSGIIFNGGYEELEGDQTEINLIDNTLVIGEGGVINASGDLTINNFSDHSSIGSLIVVEDVLFVNNTGGILGFANRALVDDGLQITNSATGSIIGNQAISGSNGHDFVVDGNVIIENDGHMALNIIGDQVVISRNTSHNTLSGKIDGNTIRVTSNTGSINADFGNSTTNLIMLTNDTTEDQAGLVDGCTFTVDAATGTILLSNKGGEISDTEFIGHTVVLQGTATTISGNLDFDSASVVFGEDLVATLDEAVITFNGMFQNAGTISVDAAQFADSLVLLIDNIGSGNGIYGDVVFSGDDLGYRFIELNNDLFATNLTLDTVHIDSSWDGSSFLEPVTLPDGTTAYYGFNAFSSIETIPVAASTAVIYSDGFGQQTLSLAVDQELTLTTYTGVTTEALELIAGQAGSVLTLDGAQIRMHTPNNALIAQDGGRIVLTNGANVGPHSPAKPDAVLKLFSDAEIVIEEGSQAFFGTASIASSLTVTGTQAVAGDYDTDLSLNGYNLTVYGNGGDVSVSDGALVMGFQIAIGSEIDSGHGGTKESDTHAVMTLDASKLEAYVHIFTSPGPLGSLAMPQSSLTVGKADGLVTGELNVLNHSIVSDFEVVTVHTGSSINLEDSSFAVDTITNDGTINITGYGTLAGELTGSGTTYLQNAHFETTNGIATDITGDGIIVANYGVSSFDEGSVTCSEFNSLNAYVVLLDSEVTADTVLIRNANFTIDYGSLLTATTFTNDISVITLLLTVNQSTEIFVKKMIDVSNATDFGLTELQIGSSAPIASDKFVVRDLDLWFNNSDMTTVYVNTGYTGNVGEEIAPGVFFQFNAYTSYDATAIPADSAVEFTGGQFVDSIAFTGRSFSVNGIDVSFEEVTGGELELISDVEITDLVLTIDGSSTDVPMVFTGDGTADVTNLILTGGDTLTGRGKYLVGEGWRDDTFTIELDGVTYVLDVAQGDKKFTLDGENLYLQYSNDQFVYNGTTPIPDNAFAFVGWKLPELGDIPLFSMQLPPLVIDENSADIGSGARIYGGHLIDGESYISGNFKTSITILDEVSVEGGVVGGSRMEPTYDGSTTVTMRTNISIDTTGDIGFVVGGNQVMGGTVSTTGDKYVIQIDGGNFTNWICGGSVAADDAYVATFGAQTQIVINDGTFEKAIYGGGFSQNGGQLDFYGKTNITINGGEFNGNIYGGHGANGAMQDGTAWIYGDTNITINAGIFRGSIFAGSYDNGRISGTTTLTFTGSNFEVYGRVEGDSSNAGYWDKRYVSSDRILIFDNVTNNFGASSIDNFDKVEFKNSQVAMTGTNIDFSDVEEWSFDFGSELTGFAHNDLTDDTLDLTGWQSQVDTNGWTVMSGTGYVGFDQMDVIGDLQFTWDDAGYYLASSGSDTFKLSLEGDDMKLAKLA